MILVQCHCKSVTIVGPNDERRRYARGFTLVAFVYFLDNVQFILREAEQVASLAAARLETLHLKVVPVEKIVDDSEFLAYWLE